MGGQRRDVAAGRSAIAAAAERLLAGTPLRSKTGKLTTGELGVEAGLRHDVVYQHVGRARILSECRCPHSRSPPINSPHSQEVHRPKRLLLRPPTRNVQSRHRWEADMPEPGDAMADISEGDRIRLLRESRGMAAPCWLACAGADPTGSRRLKPGNGLWTRTPFSSAWP